jgi:hypothetical protein
MRKKVHTRTAAAWSPAVMPGHVRQVSLDKGNHQYVFRCAAGRENDIIEAFVELALNAEWDFDWFDAATLAYQMGRRYEMV